MQRIRIGIIGLASVFLLTILATAIYSLLGDDTPPQESSANAVVANAADPPREPLAELGVTPGNVAPAASKPAAAPPPPAGR